MVPNYPYRAARVTRNGRAAPGRELVRQIDRSYGLSFCVALLCQDLIHVRILVINLLYKPDLGPSASLIALLCQGLARLGHEVTTIAAVPHYPTGRVPGNFRGKIIDSERSDGVQVIRVWVPSVNRAKLGQRALTFVAYQVFATLAGLPLKYDVVIATNPAIEVFLPVLALSVIRHKPLIFSVYDIYPDIGIHLGIFRSGLVTKAVRALEHFCLGRAAVVRVISEGFKRVLRDKGVAEAKLRVVWDWVDTDFIVPLRRVNQFSTAWGIDEGFVVMYAGNLGLSQGFESLIEAARLLRAHSDIKFVLVGDGSAKNLLICSVKASALGNVKFIPPQPKEVLSELLSSADVGLVLLRPGLAKYSVPSKCYSIMASGRPVIACVDEGSDTASLIQKAGCGICVPPDEPEKLAGAIFQLYRLPELRDVLGVKGRAYVERYHSPEVAARGFDRLVRDVATVGRQAR